MTGHRVQQVRDDHGTTARRPLGTGPAVTDSTERVEDRPERRLPAERWGNVVAPADVEDQAQPDGGRRRLGDGPTAG
ncbi:hypothetical protein [Kitasatospora arboriphila]|uniref:Uncharacterized protein n=1 Tax=Kitasatospora arboriphila TaxID=258052 RepID=A0ABP4EJH0_9ACTN